MTHLDEFDIAWFELLHEKRKLDSYDSHPVMIYCSERHNMMVKLMRGDNKEPIVELMLGSEVCTFPLSEFTHFWLTMIEVGCRTDRAYLESMKEAHRRAD